MSHLCHAHLKAMSTHQKHVAFVSCPSHSLTHSHVHLPKACSTFINMPILLKAISTYQRHVAFVSCPSHGHLHPSNACRICVMLISQLHSQPSFSTHLQKHVAFVSCLSHSLTHSHVHLSKACRTFVTMPISKPFLPIKHVAFFVMPISQPH